MIYLPSVALSCSQRAKQPFIESVMWFLASVINKEQRKQE